MSELSESTLTEDDGSGTSPTESEPLIVWLSPENHRQATWLDRSRLSIGRDPAAGICLPGNHVSRLHAEINRSGPLWIISDRNSKNGVTLDGERVEDAVLRSGSVLRIGDFVGVFLFAARNEELALRELSPDLFGGRLHARAFAKLSRLAKTNAPIVLEGETGTGKERFAAALHLLSGRQGPFRAVNCAVYSKSSAAAELFGYRKGAFTGADQASLGHVRAAAGGTLLLDELVDLPLDVQPMLLRVLENGEVLPLGEVRPSAIDVRFVGATQVPLSDAVEKGAFRADLRARLEGDWIALPPLRDCREVIPDLFGVLFEKEVGARPSLGASFIEELCLHDWPLNLRELSAVVRRVAGVAASGAVLQLSDFRSALRDTNSASKPAAEVNSLSQPPNGRRWHSEREPYRADEVRALVGALSNTKGNLTKAAAEMGISRQKAQRLLKAHRRTPP